MTDEKKPHEAPAPAVPAAPPVHPTHPVQQSDEGLAIVSMVLGVLSFTGPGLLTGIPAIITGAIALKKKRGSRAMSITGLVTGIVSTVFSLLFIAFVILAIYWGWGSQPTPSPYQESERAPGQSEQFFDSRT